MGLCEALEFRKSVARVIWSQTGHIWKYNYREASVAGGKRPMLRNQHCEQAWSHTPLSPRVHTPIVQARMPLSPRVHVLVIFLEQMQFSPKKLRTAV